RHRMKAVRWVLVVTAALVAVAGIVVLSMPYDTTFHVPPIAGAPGVDAELPCKAPLVDLLTDEPAGGWLNYTPDQGVSVESSGRVGGELCADAMRSRGVLGLGLIMGGVCFAATALMTTRFRRETGSSDRAPDATLDGPGDRPEDPAADGTTSG
ncbi:MAG: hypothetical protein ACTHN0_20090, partial [Aquihabitans sp.]